MAKLTSVSLNGNSSDVADAYSKSETDTLLAGKQATLTPGSGINISSNNVISATGGSATTLFDAPLDSNGNIHTGGAITPTGLVKSMYGSLNATSEAGTTGLNITGPLKDGETRSYDNTIFLGRHFNGVDQNTSGVVIGMWPRVNGENNIYIGGTTPSTSETASQVIGDGNVFINYSTRSHRNLEISSSSIINPFIDTHAGYVDQIDNAVIMNGNVAFNSSDVIKNTDRGGAIAIGHKSLVTQRGGIAIGYEAQATLEGGFINSKLESICIGNRARAVEGGITIGKRAKEDGIYTSENIGGIVVGNNELSPYYRKTPIAIGHAVTFDRVSGSIAVGNSSSAGDLSVAIGHSASCGSVVGSVAVGDTATTGGGDSIAIGRDANAGDRKDTIAIGHAATPSGWRGVAVGAKSSGSGAGTISIGYDSYAYNPNQDESMDFNGEGSIAIGCGAVAMEDKTLSVGHKVGDTRATGGAFTNHLRRRIVNVADGTDNNDAVTKQQLDAAIAALQAQIDALRS